MLFSDGKLVVRFPMPVEWKRKCQSSLLILGAPELRAIASSAARKERQLSVASQLEFHFAPETFETPQAARGRSDTVPRALCAVPCS